MKRKKFVAEKSAARDLIDDAKQSGPSTIAPRDEPERTLKLPLPTGHPYLVWDFP